VTNAKIVRLNLAADAIFQFMIDMRWRSRSKGLSTRTRSIQAHGQSLNDWPVGWLAISA